MSELYQSLAHSKWDCKYHLLLVPKRRRKAIFGLTCRQMGAIFHALARQKECQILEGHRCWTRCPCAWRNSIPPQHPVASGIGFHQGKSAIAMAGLHGRDRDFWGEPFWARG
jgi:putative transposase